LYSHAGIAPICIEKGCILILSCPECKRNEGRQKKGRKEKRK
jgi:hypothetical protein